MRKGAWHSNYDDLIHVYNGQSLVVIHFHVSIFVNARTIPRQITVKDLGEFTIRISFLKKSFVCLLSNRLENVS